MRCWTSPISRMASTHVSCTQVSAEAAIVDCFVAHSHAWVGPRQPPHCAEFFAAVATLFVQLNAAALPERDRDADRPDGNMHMCVPVRVLLPKLQALADDATIRYVVRLRVQASRLRVDTPVGRLQCSTPMFETLRRELISAGGRPSGDGEVSFREFLSAVYRLTTVPSSIPTTDGEQWPSLVDGRHGATSSARFGEWE